MGCVLEYPLSSLFLSLSCSHVHTPTHFAWFAGWFETWPNFIEAQDLLSVGFQSCFIQLKYGIWDQGSDFITISHAQKKNKELI